MGLKIAVEPAPADVQGAAKAGQGAQARNERVQKALLALGAEIVSAKDAKALVWLDVGSGDHLGRFLDEGAGIEWVQLPWAGVESFAAAGLFNRDIRFTCNKGALGEQVGEHALFLTLACLRHVTIQARSKQWLQIEPHSLFGKSVTVLGAGGIAETLVALLTPFGCEVTAVRRSNTAMEGVTRTVGIDGLDAVLPVTDVLVVAVPLTPETTGMIGAEQLGLLPSTAIVINVARGAVVDTPALVDALKNGTIASAGLDVTDPEPLPADHPLWQMDNVLITSHCADSMEFVTDKLIERIQENYRRFEAGESLVGEVHAGAGY